MVKKRIYFAAYILNSIATFLIVKNYANFLEPFEDEITSILSGVTFIESLDFNGSPLIIGNYSPYLTSGPVASIGSALGWIFTKNFVISRIFNFYFLMIFVYLLFAGVKKFKNEEVFLKLNFILFAIILTPWWFGSLYSLGEMFSSTIFALSILLIKNKTNLALFLMSFSVVFGKFIQILLVVPFLIIYIFINKKFETINAIFFIAPIFVYFLLVNIKLDSFNIFDYLEQYIGIIYSHQSSGFSLLSSLSLNNILTNLNNSEFSQWSTITKLRVVIAPIIFSGVLLLERKNLKTHFSSVFPFLISVNVPYIWFLFFSETKWIRYSQHFVYLVVFFSLLFLLFEYNLSTSGKTILILNLSLFMSSVATLIIFIISLFFLKKQELFRSVLMIFLLFNSINLLYESNKLLPYNLDIRSCKENISSLSCVNDYLQYNFVSD